MSPKEYLELFLIAIVYSGLIFLNINLFNIGIFNNNKKKIIFFCLLLIVTIPSIFLPQHYRQKYLVVSVFLFSVIYLTITNKKFAINTYVLMMVNCSYLLSFIILQAILIYVLQINDVFFTSMSFGNSISLITQLPLSLLFSIFMSEFVNRFYYEVKSKNKRSAVSTMLPIVSFILTSLIFLLIPNYYYELKSKDIIFGSFSFLIILILFILLVTLSYFYIIKNERDLESLEIDRDKFEGELENITNYMNALESSTSELRKFKHDYTNILSVIGLYLEEKEYDKLKDYFYELSDYNKVMNLNLKSIDRLKHVKILQLKSLLSYKIIQSEERGIKTNIEIEQDIDMIPMNIIDLSRILGILLDNAIEATVKCEKPEIDFAIMEIDNSLLIVVKNACPADIPPIYEIFKKGFSTKGRRRGDGLWIVKSIVESYGERVTLDTEIKDGYFIHELWISKSTISD